MTTARKAAGRTAPAPLPTIPQESSFQQGYTSGVEIADREKRWGQAPLTSHEVHLFIEAHLNPLQIPQHRDAANNPIPLAYHAGFVAGYLVTLFAPAQGTALPEGGNGHV